ncbi:MAG TPA: glycine cleavage T C-terminal barrel domain-containing protein, partial [Jatrophihabitans sp.]|nr:glycine cleavage T C-terminal barrel domain-containing protein [Jatrophihabitans sp.]
FAVLAVQGPAAEAAVRALGLPTGHEYMSFGTKDRITVCRTGYTGEHGYELVVPWSEAEPVWDALVGAGVRPCGLGARDTLRTEMGYPLHGQDLTREISPVQAGSSWAVGWQKPAFWGREALLAEKAAGPARRLRGLLVTDRGVPRGHMNVLDQQGEVIGQTTSGTFSPTLKQGIALALIDSTADLGESGEVAIEVRGRKLAAKVVKLPFVPSHVR